MAKPNKAASMQHSFGLLMFVCRMLCGLWLLARPGVTMAVDVPFIPKQILIFGGNGFMGSRTSELLIEAGHSLTLVNRGNWYWDSAFTVRPHTRHIKCDRAQEVDRCSELKEFIQTSEGLDVVIDFSAYHPQYMEDSLDLIKGKAGLYIYISTDSVYEVCEKNHTAASLETDAVRPISPKKRSELEAGESYGNFKLACEEVLERHRAEESGPPYISLRLPDVVGPRDSTYRWWVYQMWMRLREYLEKDVQVPAKLVSQPMSLVYVEDVAKAIFQIVQSRARYATSPAPDNPPLDQAYNLALKETPTLLQLLQDIRAELNLTDTVDIRISDRDDTIQLFPSVKLGPVDITKAEKLMGWSPTDYKTVVKETVAFYEDAISTVHFDEPRKYMIRTMQTYFTSKPYDVIRGLGDIYEIFFGQHRDEL